MSFAKFVYMLLTWFALILTLTIGFIFGNTIGAIVGLVTFVGAGWNFADHCGHLTGFTKRHADSAVRWFALSTIPTGIFACILASAAASPDWNPLVVLVLTVAFQGFVEIMIMGYGQTRLEELGQTAR